MRTPRALGRVWVAAGTVIAGALSGYAGFGGPAAVVLTAVGACALGLRRRPEIRLLAVGMFVFGLSAMSVDARVEQGSVLEDLARRVPHCVMNGRVLEQAGGLGTLVAVDHALCGRLARASNAGVVVSELPSVDAGARIRAEGWLVPLREDSFDRARWRLGARAALIPSKVDVGRVEGALHTGAAAFRRSLRAATGSMDEDRAALLRGLAIGDTAEMSAMLESHLRSAGLSHLVAVSGSNVAIVLAVLVGLVRRLGVVASLGVGLGGLVLFVAVVGPEPSVLRAAVMGGLALAAVTSGRRAETLNLLGLALIVVVAARPALIFSVGLHLSAAATAGIVLWTRPLEQRMVFLPAFVRVPLAATAAAQFAVAPILALAFGELSLVALPANLLCAPLVAPVTITAFFAATAGLIAPGLGVAAATFASPLVGWIIEVGHRLGGLQWASIPVPSGAGWPLLAIVAAAALRSVAHMGQQTRSGYGADVTSEAAPH